MEDLLPLWYQQKEGMAEPYDSVRVQAYGLAFAYVYFKFKDQLCAMFSIDPTEFNYAMKYDIISRLENGSPK